VRPLRRGHGPHRMRLAWAAAMLLLLLAVLSGCGSSKGSASAASQTTATTATAATTTATAASVVMPSTVEACLEHAGYNVKSPAETEVVGHNAGRFEVFNDLDSGFAAKGSGRERWSWAHPSEHGEMSASGSASGQGEATIVIFTDSTGAEQAAAEAMKAAETTKAGPGSEETPAGEGVKVSWRDNAAWASWTNAAAMNEQIASCLP
jgi:hypothetical protein